jgi:hypothetical protein
MDETQDVQAALAAVNAAPSHLLDDGSLGDAGLAVIGAIPEVAVRTKAVFTFGGELTGGAFSHVYKYPKRVEFPAGVQIISHIKSAPCSCV